VVTARSAGAANQSALIGVEAPWLAQTIILAAMSGRFAMAEGYTRARLATSASAYGQSGPAGTDMITGLIFGGPRIRFTILCHTGQAPRRGSTRKTFRPSISNTIAKSVTKWAVTVREPGVVPACSASLSHNAFGPSGPVADRPARRLKLAEIEFDDEPMSPLAVYKPAPRAGRASKKALAMPAKAAERPLIVAGGGVINAGMPRTLLVAFAEAVTFLVPTLRGGAPSRTTRCDGRMVGLQTRQPLRQRGPASNHFVIGIGTAGPNRHRPIETYNKGPPLCACGIEPSKSDRVFNPNSAIGRMPGSTRIVRSRSRRNAARRQS